MSSVEAALGMGAIVVMVTLTGYSAIYFERMLKKEGERITIWERNFQLAFYSIVLLVGVVVSELNTAWTIEREGERAAGGGGGGGGGGGDPAGPRLFEGWTIHTILIALIQASGGMLVAATLKYADAVLKTLATSGSIVISAVLSFLFLEGTIDLFVCLGAVATILAITNYTLGDVGTGS